MTYDPQAVLDALRALVAARDGSAPYERADIASDATGMRLFTVSSAGYVFTLFAESAGAMARVREWQTPDGAHVSDGASLDALDGADWVVMPRLNTDFGRLVVTPDDVATAWRAAADYLNSRNRSQEITAP